MSFWILLLPNKFLSYSLDGLLISSMAHKIRVCIATPVKSLPHVVGSPFFEIILDNKASKDDVSLIPNIHMVWRNSFFSTYHVSCLT